MDANLHSLYASVVEAVARLQRDPDPLDARAHHALAVLQAALVQLPFSVIEELRLPASDPDTARRDVSDDDPASIDALHPAPRRLIDYRRERNLSMRDFTDLLGITQQEYAHVIHRLPIDRRLRDQIADKLGVPWSAIAEFMPGAALDWPEATPIPAPAGAPPPSEPWYVVHPTTGRIVSGPHNEPLPENAAYLHDLLTYTKTNLVVLFDSTNEEALLPPEGYIANEEDDEAEDVEDDAAYRALVNEPIHFRSSRRAHGEAEAEADSLGGAAPA